MSADESTAADTAHADVGLVHATSLEIGEFIDRCERVRKYTGGPFTFRGGRLGAVRVACAQAGMGCAPARAATQALLDGHTPRWVLSVGYSGALAPSLKVGDIVVGDRLVDRHGNSLSIDVHMPADPAHGLHVGTLLTVDEFIRSAEEKRHLGDQFQALACDMESLAVAQVCHERKTRFLAVRVISDDALHDLPPEILTVVGDTGTVRLGAVLGALWKRPGAAKDLWKLRELAQRAAHRLAGFLDGVITQLVPG